MALPNGYSNFQTKCFTICAKLYLNIISLQVQQQAEQKQRQQQHRRQRQWQHRQTSRRCQRMRFEVRRSSTAAQGISTMYYVYIYVFVGVPLSVFVCSTFQVLPPRKRVDCAPGWVYAAVKLRFTCELNLSAVIFRQVFRITE